MDFFEIDEKRNKLVLKRFAVARAAIITIVALSCAIVQVKSRVAFDLSTTYLYAVFAVAFIESLVVAAVLRTAYQPTARFSFVLLTADLVLITAVVMLTGGDRSALAFLYIAAILSASILLSFSWSIAIATICSGLFLLAVAAEHAGLVAPASAFRSMDPPMAVWELWAYLSMKVLAFYLTAFLSGYLSHRIGELQSFQHDLLNSFSSGFICVDRDLRVTFFNAAAAGLLQRATPECIGKDVSSAFPVVGEGPNPLREAVVEEKECQGKEVHISRGDGKQIPVGVTVSPLRNHSGKPVGALASFVDLTELKRMEERLRRADRLAAVGEMSASLAHEIRNPVASIRGAVQELAENLRLTGTEEQLMKIAIKESDQLSKIISSFLEFVDTSPIGKAPFELGEILDDAVQAAERRFARNGDVRILRDYPEALGNMTGDRRRIKEALVCIIQNGIEAMAGGGELRIGAGGCDDSPGGLSVRIQDEGVGIPAGDIDRVFDLFFTTKPGGMGLGMAIAHKIITSHGGSIDIESIEGEGTIITLALPREV